jgi:hypothetical protein
MGVTIGGDVIKGDTIRCQIISGARTISMGDTIRCDTSLILNAFFSSWQSNIKYFVTENHKNRLKTVTEK